MNRYNEALVDYQKLISLNPKDGSAHRRISSIKTFHKKDEQFALMRDLVCSDTLPKNEKCEIYYALAKAYDDVGCLDRAFESLREGGRLRKEILSYDIEQDKELFEKIKEMAIQIVKIGTIKWEAVSVNPILYWGCRVQEQRLLNK